MRDKYSQPLRRKLTSLFVIVIASTILASCSGAQYYAKSNLNSMSIGQSKEALLNNFNGNAAGGVAVPPMVIRAAQKSDDELIEVGEMLLSDGSTGIVAYWFLFQNGILEQWGQPEDWKDVKARYEINYNPSIGVSR